ncbi:unknown; predicted coding region [Mycoplasmopsis pulmonis]|uniref:Uncharacterized protein n=1 Tax=Mycoplasmopsis pulmonis (strain UAB CTIP) TaxID=272635 RepID=Q98RD0_MYCPU|nr:unknown; predicted coding region [Mycoplasmopsis pulmonis]
MSNSWKISCFPETPLTNLSTNSLIFSEIFFLSANEMSLLVSKVSFKSFAISWTFVLSLNTSSFFIFSIYSSSNFELIIFLLSMMGIISSYIIAFLGFLLVYLFNQEHQ